MNQDETLRLFNEGKEAWNDWARDLLTRREELEAAREWEEAARADFTEHIFESKADFSGFLFPGQARFVGATFRGSAWFQRATFRDFAWFEGATFRDSVVFQGATFRDIAGFQRATFRGRAEFQGATFRDSAWFKDATFRGSAWFEGATFRDIAEFEGADFEKPTRFDGAIFFAGAGFYAIKADRAFSLAGASFNLLPDFIQSHFAESPRLDNLRIQPRGFRRLLPLIKRINKPLGKQLEREQGFNRRWRKQVPDQSARWRALKRLAIQSHDHVREQAFFRRELRAQRGHDYRAWHPAWWAGWAYQILANFGGSIVLPLFWYGVNIAGFALLYMYLRPAEAVAEAAGDKTSLVGWLGRQAAGLWPGPARAAAAGDTCMVGKDDAWVAAWHLSLSKGLLFFGGANLDWLKQLHACLYGWETLAETGAAYIIPVIPPWVALAGLVQQVVSAVLLFLLLLAMRNHFRIK